MTEASVRACAQTVISSCPTHEWGCQVRALRSFLGRVWTFVRDPVGIELVRRPERLLDLWRLKGHIPGDCDDAAVLGAALGKSVGFPARFVVLGFYGPRMPFSHVYAELQAPDGWVDLDVTRTPARLPVTRCAIYSI